MSNKDTVDRLFARADTNRDGKIDKSELRNLLAKDDASRVDDGIDNDPNRYEPYRYKNPGTITSNYVTDEDSIKTNGPEETKRYLQNLGNTVYVDSNPHIVRRQNTERPMTYEQRITLRCLQPPPIPTLEPLIIKEVRPDQPPPPAPLIIREHGACVSQPPPLVLRERPPQPPPRIPGETIIRHLPPVPVPPRSLIIERYPNCPEKPRDIIIERWLPYPQDTERRQIIQPAPPPIKYPAPTHTVVIYEDIQATVVRKVERLGVTREDPDAYVARHGSSLLDRDTLVHRARAAGVVEDISCLSSSGTVNPTPRSYADEPAIVGSYVSNQRVSNKDLRAGYTVEDAYAVSGSVFSQARDVIEKEITRNF